MPTPCRLYLITPPRLDDLADFGQKLAEALDGGDVAALQIRLKDVDDAVIEAAVQVLMPIAHARHNDMLDAGPDWLKARIVALVRGFLADGRCPE